MGNAESQIVLVGWGLGLRAYGVMCCRLVGLDPFSERSLLTSEQICKGVEGSAAAEGDTGVKGLGRGAGTGAGDSRQETW